MRPDYGWNWDAFQGTRRCLNLNRVGLVSVDMILPLIQQPRVAVQAGGNLGIFPKRLAQVFERVYTFEPAPELFTMLKRNAPERNITRIHAALGNDHATVAMSGARRDGKSLPPHEGLMHVEGAGAIQTLRIDDLHLPVCDLIYLDVEGSEADALLGARETMARCRPVLAVEMNDVNTGLSGLTPSDLCFRILTYGYRRVATCLADDVFLPVAA